MKNEVVVKLLVLFVLVFLSLIPLGLIWRVVADRANYRDRVVTQVAQTSARAQVMTGPILVMEWPGRYYVGTTGQVRDSVDQIETQLVFPDSLGIQSTVKVETRERGIYRVPVYRSTSRFAATFTIPTKAEVTPRFTVTGPPTARIVFGVSDSRGLRITPTIKSGEASLKVNPNTQLTWLPQGFSAPFELSEGLTAATIVADIDLTGTDRLGLVPVGANTDVSMDSNWPHPGFTGGFSPDDRDISSQGFRARWRLSRLATGDPIALAAPTTPQGHPENQANDIGVRFIQPVDIYQQSERAAKYGILFVSLTFVAFFLFETLRRMRIHPIQYSLVAAALAIFFLLLVSLSEHLPFVVAYGVAAASCVSLVAFYTGHVLGAMNRGFGFGGMLATLYLLLYVILQSEDYALLLGALLLFGALAAVMVITRRVDWYRLQETTAAKT